MKIRMVLLMVIVLVGFSMIHARQYGLETIKGRVLQVRGDHYYPPYEFINEQGKPDGFNVELFQALAAHLELKYELELKPWNQARHEIETGTCDVVLGLLVSEQRAEKMLFGIPHSMMTHAIFTHKSKPFESLEELRGKEIVVQDKDMMHDMLLETGLTDRIIAVPGQLDALRLINDGKHDAALLGNFQGAHLIQEYKLKQVSVGTSGIEPNNYAMAVKKGDDELIWLLNMGLFHLKSTGEYDQIYQKWFSVYDHQLKQEKMMPYYIGFAGVIILFVVFLIVLRTRVRYVTKALRQSEQRYRALVETSQEAIFINDQNRITYINPAGIKLFGVEDPSEILGKSPYDFFHPDYHEIIAERIQKLLQDNSTVRVENEKIFRPDQKLLDVEVAATAIQLGNRKAIMVVMRDITERLKGESQITEKNEFIQTVLENLPIGLALNRIEEGQAFYMNRKFEEIYGWPAQEMQDIGAFFQKVYPDELYRNELLARIMGDISSGDPSRMHWSDIRITRSDGSLAYVNAVNIPLIEQNTMVSTVMDITELKTAEQKIKDSARVFQHAMDMLCIAGFDGYFKVLNPAWSRILGWSTEELLSRPWNDFVHPEDIERTNSVSATLIDGIEAYRFENRYICKDGSIKWLSWNSVPYPHDNVMVGSARDITEQKKTELALISSEEELQQQFEEMQSLNEDLTSSNEKIRMINLELQEAVGRADAIDKLKTAFLNNISHEVRTPLNGILGVASLLADASTPQQDREMLSDIIDLNTQRLLRTITQYMDVSLLTSGNYSLSMQPVRPATWFKEFAGRYEQQCSRQNVAYAVVIPQHDPEFEINTDTELLGKLLDHLIDNAIKFTSKGEVETGYLINKSEIEFYVRDTGIGIDQAVQGKLFDPFMLEGGESLKKHDGTGLGLAICRLGIQLLKGRIWFSSETGRGSIFRFAIPLTAVESLRQQQPQFAKAKSINTLVLAEDEETNFAVLSIAIRKMADVTVLKATNGVEAVDLVRSNPDVGLVLMDIRMPVMDGFEATKLIKAMRPELPVVAITAYGMSGDERRVRAAGCDDYLAKPVTRPMLQTVLSKYLDVNPMGNKT